VVPVSFVRLALGLGLLALACSGDSSEPFGDTNVVRIFVAQDLAENVEEFVSFIPSDQIAVVRDEAPWDAAREQRGISIAVLGGDTCESCYRLESQGTTYRVTGDRLGAQVGLAHVLEEFGVRFFSPFSTYVPASLVDGAQGVVFDGTMHAPEMSERGVQLHILHTIEALYALWMPSPSHRDRAKAITDWLVKSRVNLMTWTGLDDITRDPETADAWRLHTAAIVDYAHRRGLRAGIGVQIFGSSNLQKAYDLVPMTGTDEENRASMRARFELLFDGVEWDHVTFSFGEFSGKSPSVFLSSLNLAQETLQEVSPGTTASSVIHVGNYEDLYVEYEGETYLYYLLAQFADPSIVPWVHTVMYYNLFDDAGGAYLHDDFGDHRELLLSRLAQGLPVGYFPETAYWVAFDNSVPTYLPLYMWSRWRDVAEIARIADEAGHPSLDRHITFSSGWEWGYWQNDYAIFRMGYAVAEDWREHVREMFAPFGEAGGALAAIVGDAAEEQRHALMDQRLAAYMAGRDGIIDIGELAGIVSQPARVHFRDIPTMEAGEREAFVASTIVPLEAHAEALSELRRRAAELALPAGETWRREIEEGLDVTSARAAFMAALLRAAEAHADGTDPAPHLAKADNLLAQASEIVERRHVALAYPSPAQLTKVSENPTIYPYGYLEMADTLCYWRRERAEVEGVTLGMSVPVPRCFEFAGF
jgi:hypothetical protein